jgi:hypothetical protein
VEDFVISEDRPIGNFAENFTLAEVALLDLSVNRAAVPQLG